MSSSVLAFLASSKLFDEKRNTHLTLVVGALSAVVVFFQTMSGILVYGSRAAMHDATAISFRNLRDDLNMIQFGMAVEERRRSRMKPINGSHDDDDSDDDNDGDTDIAFNDLLIRLQQCQKGLQSVVPMPISDAFHCVDSNLRTMITEHNIKQIRRLYGEYFTLSTYENINFKAFDILVGEFLGSQGFPFFLPDPNIIVDKTMQKLWIHMHKINDEEAPAPCNKIKKILKKMSKKNHDEEQGEKKVMADV